MYKIKMWNNYYKCEWYGWGGVVGMSDCRRWFGINIGGEGYKELREEREE